jgi:hypothetical protein
LKQIFVYRYHGYPNSSVPDYPENFPVKMLIYHWFSRVKSWHPREVDKLTLEEVEWIPILHEASELASDIISREMQAQRK